MKNFRKVLALVLVVATLFSFASVAGAYTDDAAIAADYSEAVGVLSAIGILNGYEDGSFKPASTIDRDEMAKMVAVLANAGDDSVHTVYEGSCNFADTTTNWAKSYIGYCAHTGIVAGRSATTFDPNGKVTGLETAKMLLVVLGFNAEKQGYVGSNWKVNVIRDAKNFGLLDNFAADFDATKAITREQAAQMFLNALSANIVIGTLSDNIIDISNASYGNLQNLNGKNWTLIDAEKYGVILVYGNVIVSENKLVESFIGVVKTEPTVDCHGRPATEWTFVDAKGKVTPKTFVDTKTLYKTYTTTAGLAADLAAYCTGKYSIVVYEDGNVADLAKQTLPKDVNASNAPGTALLKTIADNYTGKGVNTEVYVDETANTITVVVMNTYIGKVASVNARTGKFVLTNKNGDVATLNNTDGFKKDDVVLYWLCGDGSTVCTHCHAVTLAPATTGKVTYTYTTNASKPESSMFKADGKDYEYAHNYGKHMGDGAVLTKDAVDNNAKKKVIYTDLNGYVMLLTDAASASTPKDVAVFLGATWTEYKDTVMTPTGGNGYWTNDMVTFDGAVVEDVKVNKALVDSVVERYTTYADKGVNGALIMYADKDTKEFVDRADFAMADSLLTSNSGVITAGELYGDNNTKYLIHTVDGYKAVTGYKNLDRNYLANTITWYDDDAVAIQYFDTNDDKIAEYVYINAVRTNTYQSFYVLGKAGSASWNEIYGDIDAYELYEVLVGTEKAVLALHGAGTQQLGNGLYYSDLIYLGADAAMLKDGTTVPLYVNATNVPFTAESTNGYVTAVGNGLVTIVDSKASENYSYLDAADEVVVIDIVYGTKGDRNTYKTYEVLDTVRDNTLWNAFATYIVKDGNGDVCMIYREIV